MASTTGGDSATMAMAEMELTSAIAVAAAAASSSRSMAELALPALLSVAIYGSIPPAVHLDDHGTPLYEPLVAFICLSVFTSLGNIVHALMKPGTGGVDPLIGLSLAFMLVAFVLRVLLLV